MTENPKMEVVPIVSLGSSGKGRSVPKGGNVCSASVKRYHHPQHTVGTGRKPLIGLALILVLVVLIAQVFHCP